MSLKPFFPLFEFSMFFPDHLNTLGVTGLYVNHTDFTSGYTTQACVTLVCYVQKYIFRCSMQDLRVEFQSYPKTLESNYFPAPLPTLENPTVDMQNPRLRCSFCTLIKNSVTMEGGWFKGLLVPPGLLRHRDLGSQCPFRRVHFRC